MKTISLAEHICAKCRTKFIAPVLSDFCYGEFLLWSAPNSCAHLNAIEDRTYEEVMYLIDEKIRKGAASGLEAHLIARHIYGAIACDVDNGKQPYHMGYPPCPNCGSTHIDSISEEILGDVSIPEVSHEVWDSLSDQEKGDRLERALIGLPTSFAD